MNANLRLLVALAPLLVAAGLALAAGPGPDYPLHVVLAILAAGAWGVGVVLTGRGR